MRPSSRGHTVVELAVAMTVLAAGSAVLWYGLRASARLDKLNRLHHVAFLAARSDMESLRLLPKENIHDTSYAVSGPGGEPLRLIRQVFDSVRIFSSMSEIALDERLSPMELRKPLEVKVRVLLNDSAGPGGHPDESTDWGPWDGWPAATGSDEPVGRALVTLILKLPEYRWY